MWQTSYTPLPSSPAKILYFASYSARLLTSAFSKYLSKIHDHFLFSHLLPFTCQATNFQSMSSITAFSLKKSHAGPTENFFLRDLDKLRESEQQTNVFIWQYIEQVKETGLQMYLLPNQQLLGKEHEPEIRYMPVPGTVCRNSFDE